MKLISCHIENFGRLRNFDYRFSEGVNIICRENGWGKSTFSAFLRAMFYGIPGTRRKKTEDNERERYRPWQGGIYGGRLVFEARGKRYEMTRVFGRKESEDEFELRDLGTGLLSADFSDRIGEELFRLNRDSFSRTVFTGQLDCSSSATDDVNALVADLTEHAGDMGNYEAAMRRLTEAANRLTPKRTGGRMYRRSEEIRQLERGASSGGNLAEHMRICERKSREADGEEQALCCELQKLNRRIEEAESNEEKTRRALEMETYRAGSREMRLRLTAARNQREKEMESALAVFPGRVPARAEVEEYLMKCRELERLEAKIQAGQLDEEEQARLSELEAGLQDIRETEETDEIREADETGGRDETGGKDETKETDETWRADETGGKDETKKTDETWGADETGKTDEAVVTGDIFRVNIEKAAKKDGTGISGGTARRGRTGGGKAQIFIICGIIGTALLAAGMTGAALTANHGFVIPIAIGALIVATGAVSFYLHNEKKAVSLLKTKNSAGEKTRAERREYEALRRKEKIVEKYYADWYEARKPILRFLRELGYPSTDDDLRPRLEMLRDAADDCEDAGRLLREAEGELRSFDAEMRRKGILPDRENGEHFLGDSPVGPEAAPVIEQLLGDSSVNSEAALGIEQLLGDSSVNSEAAPGIGSDGSRTGPPESRVDNTGAGESPAISRGAVGSGVEKVHTTSSGVEQSRGEDSRSLRRLAGETQEALLICREKQTAYRRELDELRAEYEEWENSMQRLEKLRAQQEEDRSRYERITAAASNLRAAKEGLTARYADPITGSFRRYWECITGHSAAGAHVDADSRVTVDEMGRQRNAALLSAGYRDLAGICLRIALADAMYPTGRRERPPLIMDDPFCSLDDEKIEGAMYFLREAGKNYQIIYFTCSSARC